MQKAPLVSPGCLRRITTNGEEGAVLARGCQVQVNFGCIRILFNIVLQIVAIQPLHSADDSLDKFCLQICDSWNTLNVILHSDLNDMVFENQLALGQVIRLDEMAVNPTQVRS